MLILFVVVLYGPILLITILVSWEREDNTCRLDLFGVAMRWCLFLRHYLVFDI